MTDDGWTPTLEDAVQRMTDQDVKLLTVAVNRHLQEHPQDRLKVLHDILAEAWVDRGFSDGQMD